MEYRHLGKAGIKVSELSFGSWITFGTSLDLTGAKACIKTAFDKGINFFDNAETYASGLSEIIMGKVIKDYRREDLVISTKLFWGGSGVNDQGLSRKHLIEGIKNSLSRLDLDYVDLLYCHRPDPNTPIEETVRAMDWIIKQGYAFYWGTSEWKGEDIEKAYEIAHQMQAIPPTMEQPEYNMFHRNRVENEYTPLYHKHQMGLTTWSPLNQGILSGKYNAAIPEGSRLQLHPRLKGQLTEEKISKVQALDVLAQDLQCSLAQLALAWCLKNPHVSSVITGASKPEQIAENLSALEVKKHLTKEVMDSIDSILQGNPG